MRKHWFNIGIIFVLSAIAIVPALVYPEYFLAYSGSTDAQAHITVMSQLQIGQPLPSYNYFGQIIVGFPLSWVQGLFGIEWRYLFIWFSSLSLLGATVAIYVTISKLANKVAGLVAVCLLLFCARGLLTLYITSVTFALINMLIILPIAVYFMVDWVSTHSKRSLIASLALFALFSVFHTTALYLSPVMFALLIVYAIVKDKRVVAYATSVIVLNIALVAVSLPYFASLLGMTAGNITNGIRQTVGTTSPTLSLPLFIDYLSPYVLALLIGSMIALAIYHRHIIFDGRLSLALLFYGLLVVGLFVFALTGYSIEPFRSMMDLVSMLAVLTACLAGVILTNEKVPRTLVPVASLVVVVGVMSTMLGYVEMWEGVR